MTQATDSQIAMWRGAIALAWADGKLDAAEKAELIDFFEKNLFLSDAQRAKLMNDMNTPIALKDVWADITDTQDRAHLIDIAPEIFAQDGDYSATEHALYDKMFAAQMKTVDVQKLQEEIVAIKASIPLEQAQVAKEYEAEFNNWGLAGRLIYKFNKMLGVD